MINSIFAVLIIFDSIISVWVIAYLLRRLNRLREQNYALRNDLVGHCPKCAYYEVWAFLRGEGYCRGCKHLPHNGGASDNWMWRGEK